MSYLALYRKYRPVKFEDVIGQETTIKILKNSLKEGKIGHAYLFCGPRGTGKTTIAKIMGRAVNCLDSVDGDVCGKCENCLSLEKNANDIIEIDAASNNSVDDIREIRNNAKLMPNVGKYKVYIIDEVHMLSAGAFNAMLKTLEEPPAHVIFILATTEVQKIPITILSRCQKFDFQKIPANTMLKRLKEILEIEKKSLSDNILNLIVKLSDGCCRDAINLLDQILSLDENATEEDVYSLSGDISDNTIYELIDSIVNANYSFGLDIIDELNKNGKNLNLIVNKMLINFRNLSIFRYNKEHFGDSEKKFFEKYDIDEEKILEISKLLLELSNELKRSVMQKLIFEIYFMKMCSLFKNDTSSEKVDVMKNDVNELNNIKVEENKVEESKTENIVESSFLKQKRINNVLSRASKTYKSELEGLFSNLDEYSSNKVYNNAYSILCEGKIAVASDEYVMLVFKYDSNISLLEKNIKEVELLLKKVLNSAYKVVAVTELEWDKLKNEYIKNRDKFIYEKEEVISESKTSSNDQLNDTVFDIFGEDNVIIK